MPTYDYFCPANDRTVEIQHGMSERIGTWGELCERAGVAPGRTPAATPVERLATGGNIVGASSLGSGNAPSPCESGNACGSCPAFN